MRRSARWTSTTLRGLHFSRRAALLSGALRLSINAAGASQPPREHHRAPRVGNLRRLAAGRSRTRTRPQARGRAQTRPPIARTRRPATNSPIPPPARCAWTIGIGAAISNASVPPTAGPTPRSSTLTSTSSTPTSTTTSTGRARPNRTALSRRFLITWVTSDRSAAAVVESLTPANAMATPSPTTASRSMASSTARPTGTGSSSGTSDPSSSRPDQQVLDQAEQALCLDVDVVRDRARALGGDVAPDEDLRSHVDRGHRRPQLVRQDVEERRVHWSSVPDADRRGPRVGGHECCTCVAYGRRQRPFGRTGATRRHGSFRSAGRAPGSRSRRGAEPPRSTVPARVRARTRPTGADPDPATPGPHGHFRSPLRGPCRRRPEGGPRPDRPSSASSRWPARPLRACRPFVSMILSFRSSPSRPSTPSSARHGQRDDR